MRHQRAALVTLLLLAGIVAVPAVLTLRQVRQERLNHALIAAVDRNDAADVRLLLRQGADPNAQVLSEDARPVWKRLRDLLLHRSQSPSIARQSALLEAIEWDPANSLDNVERVKNVDTIKALVNAGANVNFRGDSSGLMYGGGARAVRDEPFKTTPLIAAGVLGKYDCIKVVLEHHPDVNAADSTDMTLLMVAAGDGKVDLVEALLNRGARLEATDTGERTALFWALEPNNDPISVMRGVKAKTIVDVRNMVSLLLRYGVNVNHRDNNDSTVMLLAHDYWHDKQLIQMFRQAGAKE